ncbi:hypothetical protein [Cedecea lapagei]|uniref:hypothetical protein n=1 Tax=Cedecea lapagei TaxID=158823 RepID=UPI001BCEF234|nr:hypothetical protein [Cedecea lapagei]
MPDKILTEYYLTDNKRVVLIDRLGMGDLYGKEECARNIYLLSQDGTTIWQVSSDFDNEGNPFTNLALGDDCFLHAYRWDAGSYRIDLRTGRAIPDKLIK